MDITPTVSLGPNIPLEEAKGKEFRLKQKLMKAIHHAEFLRKCTETERVPIIGLRLQHQKIHLMEAPHTDRTQTAIAQAYKCAEHDIRKALQEHYMDIITHADH